MDAPDLDKKRCPFCAEEIQAAAIVCRYCGRDVVEWKAPAAAPVAKASAAKTPSQRKQLGFGVLLLLIACGWMTLLSMLSAKPSTTAVPLVLGTGTPKPTEATRVATATPTVAPIATATRSPAEWQAEALPVEFEELARDTEAWVGKLVRLRGVVMEVSERDEGASLLVYITKPENRPWTDTVWVDFPGYGPGQRVLEDDLIEFVAQVDGRHTYTAVLGQKITLPRMTAMWLAVQ